MGIRGLMTEIGMNGFATIALLISFGTFVSVILWTWTRPRQEIETQARLPIDDEE